MQPDWLLLFSTSLACFRLALLISDDSGPYKMFSRFRSFIRRESKHNTALRKSDFKKGVQCLRCETVIFGLLIAPYVYFHDHLWAWLSMIGDVFILAMALSGLAVLYHRAFPQR